ncbi:MAG: hypothetical protein ACREH7_03975, partial [Candidatus Rokuibacteriota bacterium]
LRSREPILVRGRVDETEKGRVVLAEDIRPLEEDSLSEAAGPDAQTCRIRVPANGEAGDLLESVRRLAVEHPGRVPLFLHLLLPDHEVVIRAGGLSVQPSEGLVARVEALLGQGSILIEYASVAPTRA